MQHHQHYLTIQQVADRLGVSCSLLHKMKRLGGGPTFHRFGRSVRYSVADVDGWANARIWKSVRVAEPAGNRSPVRST